MPLQPRNFYCLLLLLSIAGIAALPPAASAAACTTQAQMTPPQRDAITTAARAMLSQMQSGDVQSLRANTIPAVAADFNAIQSSVEGLKPLLQGAALTVDDLYLLDATADPPGEQNTDFFCGSPVVGFNFNGLPPATYALAILHATGVKQPQQVSFILSKSAGDRWMLAGFFDKPMIEAGHDGLWYWTSARKFAQSKMDWDAWFYYRIATNLLDPLDFLSSPNLDKLRRETAQVHPASFPGAAPLVLNVGPSIFTVSAIDTTTTFGPLDLDVHYVPDTAQIAELRYPVNARKQVSDLMSALLRLHPELQGAFHGMWIHADQGNASLFALELPMEGAAAASGASTTTQAR